MGIHMTHPRTLRTFTWQQIKDNSYLVAHGKVYNISNYRGHPGGQRALINSQGINTTKDFDFHSKIARKKWNEYCIGIVKG